MTDDDPGGRRSPLSRRGFLASASTLAAVGLAGCSSVLGGDDDGVPGFARYLAEPVTADGPYSFATVDTTFGERERSPDDDGDDRETNPPADPMVLHPLVQLFELSLAADVVRYTGVTGALEASDGNAVGEGRLLLVNGAFVRTGDYDVAAAASGVRESTQFAFETVHEDGDRAVLSAPAGGLADRIAVGIAGDAAVFASSDETPAADAEAVVETHLDTYAGERSSKVAADESVAALLRRAETSGVACGRFAAGGLEEASLPDGGGAGFFPEADLSALAGARGFVQRIGPTETMGPYVSPLPVVPDKGEDTLTATTVARYSRTEDRPGDRPTSFGSAAADVEYGTDGRFVEASATYDPATLE